MSLEEQEVQSLLLEQLLPADAEVPAEQSANEATDSNSRYAIARQACYDFWQHRHTKIALNTLHRFSTGGVRAASTVAFAMYLNLIYERVTLAGEGAHLFKDTQLDEFAILENPVSVQYLMFACAALFCFMGDEGAYASDIGEVGDQIFINFTVATMIFSPIAGAFYNRATRDLGAFVPAACVDVALQALREGRGELSIIAAELAWGYVCNGTEFDSGSRNEWGWRCYDSLEPAYPADSNVSRCFRDFEAQFGHPTGVVRSVSHLFDFQSMLEHAIYNNSSQVNTTAEIKAVSTTTVRQMIDAHYSQLLWLFDLNQESLPFSSLSWAYQHIGWFLAGIFIAFGLFDAVLSLLPRWDEQIRPYCYGLLQGVDTGLIKALLILSLFGHCQHPNRPTHESFESGETVTFLNIPVCSADVSTITWAFLPLLVPACLVAAYFEYNKFKFNEPYSRTYGFYLNQFVAFLEKRESLLSRLGVAFAMLTMVLTLTELLFDHLIPYGTAVQGSHSADMNAQAELITKVMLAIPAMVLGAQFEQHYLRDQAKWLPVRKYLLAFSEWGKQMLFFYLALSFFVDYQYVGGLRAGGDGFSLTYDIFSSNDSHYSSNDGSSSSDDDSSSSSSMHISPWGAFWMLLCLSGVGSAVVVADELRHKMILKKRHASVSSTADAETIALDDLGDANVTDVDAAEIDVEPEQASMLSSMLTTGSHYCSSAARWLFSFCYVSDEQGDQADLSAAPVSTSDMPPIMTTPL